jgi:hypothetical protein
VTMQKMISKAQSNDFRQQVLINSIMHLANILGIQHKRASVPTSPTFRRFLQWHHVLKFIFYILRWR